MKSFNEFINEVKVIYINLSFSEVRDIIKNLGFIKGSLEGLKSGMELKNTDELIKKIKEIYKILDAENIKESNNIEDK